MTGDHLDLGRVRRIAAVPRKLGIQLRRGQFLKRVIGKDLFIAVYMIDEKAGHIRSVRGIGSVVLCFQGRKLFLKARDLTGIIGVGIDDDLPLGKRLGKRCT